MKLWTRLQELRQSRWLPFYLPVIGTLLYIAIVILAIPSQFGETGTAESTDTESPSAAPSTSAATKLSAPRRLHKAPAAAPSLSIH